jgi:hypothetical protein
MYLILRNWLVVEISRMEGSIGFGVSVSKYPDMYYALRYGLSVKFLCFHLVIEVGARK